MKFDIVSNIPYIEEKIKDLEKFTEKSRPFTRLVFSQEFYDARAWLTDQFKSLGLLISTDEAGNLIGTLNSKNHTDKIVMIGSHIDTVPSGGRYDGIAGVIASLCVIKHIKDNNINLPFNLSVYDYLGEELNDWGISCIGTRGMIGALNEEILSRSNSSGNVLKDEINKIGGNSRSLDRPLPMIENILACLELHIEQGKILEQKNIEIGIVRSIPSISRFNVEVNGQAGHSGTILMHQRADALVVSSEIITYVNKLALKLSKESNQHFVSTIGKINVYPNSAAIIPGLVEMTIDLRASSQNARQEFIDSLKDKIASINNSSPCEVVLKDIAFAPYVEMDNDLSKAFKETSQDIGLSTIIMDSGAGHDTAHLSRIAPAAMIFIPCKDGLSHCPEEHAEYLDVSKGSAVLTEMLIKLADKKIAS